MRTMARTPFEASQENLKVFKTKGIFGRSVFADQEQHSEPAPEELFGENHMTIKDANERRSAGRRITGVFKNLRMYEPLDKDSQTHPNSPKRRRTRTFFIVGWAAGTIGFVLLFFR